MQVSVRELKDHLSYYLHQGVDITITSHKKPLATLRAIPQSSDKNSQSLLAMDGISWNGKKPQGSKKRPVLKGKSAAQYVLEDRK
jgi:antitoxin (DNA-binding transcriptional repressor) of toxin-antitoxin stability system